MAKLTLFITVISAEKVYVKGGRVLENFNLLEIAGNKTPQKARITYFDICFYACVDFICLLVSQNGGNFQINKNIISMFLEEEEKQPVSLIEMLKQLRPYFR